jgi:NAD(P)-dependent dehydrogenase (short-subunit alcohol dehydrogenase family)
LLLFFKKEESFLPYSPHHQEPIMPEKIDIPGCDLRGQTAIVTGASSGIGYRFARVLAAAGAKVAVAGRRRDRLDALVSEITESGGTAAALVMDVSDAASLRGAAERAEASLGLVTILVNNAGIAESEAATDLSLEMIDQVIHTDFRGPYVLSREVARRLIQQRKAGRIVNVASMAAYIYALQGATLYAASKSAVVRMTEALAVEWAAHHINVNAIAPGCVESEMLDALRARIGDGFIQSFPRKRLCSADKLDSTLLFLVSPASEAITGTVVKVDDGQLPR